MLLPSEIDSITDYINRHFVILEDELVGEIADSISRVNKTNIVALNQINILNQMGLLNNEVYSKVAKATNKSEEDINKIVSSAMITSFKRDNIVFSNEILKENLKISESLMQTLQADISRLNYDINNLTGTTALTTQTSFLNAINQAHIEVISGASSYTTAMIKAIDKVSKEGIDVLYPSGHKDRVEVATRRAIVTSVNQTNGELQLKRMQELGWDLVEVSAHIGARPTHAVWQGQVYSLTGSHGYKNFYEETEYGDMLGLCGINCRHTFFPFYEGSTYSYNKKELDEINNKKVNFNGKEMSYYQATQYQRYLERNIRKCTRQIEGNTQLLLNNKDIDIDQVKYSINTIKARKNGYINTLNELENQVGLKESNRLYSVGSEVKLYKQPVKKNTLFGIVKKDTILRNKTYNSIDLLQAKNNLSNYAKVVSSKIDKVNNIKALDIISNTLDGLTKKYEIKKLDYISAFRGQISNARASGVSLEVNYSHFSSLVHEKKIRDKVWLEKRANVIVTYQNRITELEEQLKLIQGDIYREKGIKKSISSYNKLIKDLEESMKFKRWSVSSSYANEDSLKATIIHEYGHIVADQYFGQLNGKRATKNGLYTNEMAILDKEIKDVYNKAKSSGDIYNISQYASTKPSEFFAECFTMYNTEKNKLPKYIRETIERTIKYGKSM